MGTTRCAHGLFPSPSPHYVMFVPYSLALSRVRRVASPQVMQPTSPSPERIVFWITMVMTSKAAAKEEELQVTTLVF